MPVVNGQVDIGLDGSLKSNKFNRLEDDETIRGDCNDTVKRNAQTTAIF